MQVVGQGQVQDGLLRQPGQRHLGVIRLNVTFLKELN